MKCVEVGGMYLLWGELRLRLNLKISILLCSCYTAVCLISELEQVGGASWCLSYLSIATSCCSILTNVRKSDS